LSESHLALFDVYLKELVEWNTFMNLTGINERGRMIIELFLDSLIPVPYLPPKGRMLDVGSGAGFPALVIKLLLPDLNLYMVEAGSKKVSFLKQIIRLLKMSGIEVVNGRIQVVGEKLVAEGFDIISARALADLKRIISWCSHLLSNKGLLVYFSGSGVEEILKGCEELMRERHLTVDRLIPYHLPGMPESRSIIILKKKLPGLNKRRP